jgi:hypothetical protein
MIEGRDEDVERVAIGKGAADAGVALVVGNDCDARGAVVGRCPARRSFPSRAALMLAAVPVKTRLASAVTVAGREAQPRERGEGSACPLAALSVISNSPRQRPISVI